MADLYFYFGPKRAGKSCKSLLQLLYLIPAPSRKVESARACALVKVRESSSSSSSRLQAKDTTTEFPLTINSWDTSGSFHDEGLEILGPLLLLPLQFPLFLFFMSGCLFRNGCWSWSPPLSIRRSGTNQRPGAFRSSRQGWMSSTAH